VTLLALGGRPPANPAVRTRLALGGQPPANPPVRTRLALGGRPPANPPVRTALGERFAVGGKMRSSPRAAYGPDGQ